MGAAGTEEYELRNDVNVSCFRAPRKCFPFMISGAELLRVLFPWNLLLVYVYGIHQPSRGSPTGFFDMSGWPDGFVGYSMHNRLSFAT